MNDNTPGGGAVAPAHPNANPQTPGTDTASTFTAPTSIPGPPPPYSYPAAPAPYTHPPVQPPPGRSGRHWGAWLIGSVIGIMLLGGLVLVLVAALVGGLLFSAVGQNEQTAVSTRTFAVNGMPSLVVTNSAGNITVQTGSGNQVTVQVTKRAWGSSVAVARSGLSNVAADLNQNGNTITVHTQFNASLFDGSMTRRSVDLLLTVPAQTNVDANLGAGNITVRQVGGAIKLVDGGGNVTVEEATFVGTSTLNTGAGNLLVDGTITDNATVDVHVGAGNATMTLPANTPAHLEASTGVGNLDIAGWQITITRTGFTGARASGDLTASPTANLNMQVGTGNLTLSSR